MDTLYSLNMVSSSSIYLNKSPLLNIYHLKHSFKLITEQLLSNKYQQSENYLKLIVFFFDSSSSYLCNFSDINVSSVMYSFVRYWYNSFIVLKQTFASLTFFIYNDLILSFKYSSTLLWMVSRSKELGLFYFYFYCDMDN